MPEWKGRVPLTALICPQLQNFAKGKFWFRPLVPLDTPQSTCGTRTGVRRAARTQWADISTLAVSVRRGTRVINLKNEDLARRHPERPAR
ncbi:hypothetical protein EVAR_39426_1 [Eumeta japonica]|uniref:Uncharacterized protein n=1 Tax=Eumeta variegata TaxID=151549 RepID=A0A4C1W1Q0_EUMVA|nr:hypothetical protein EVAR_39426_1 [Eumeta japonica]